jgi:hypothetical protein
MVKIKLTLNGAAVVPEPEGETLTLKEALEKGGVDVAKVKSCTVGGVTIEDIGTNLDTVLSDGNEIVVTTEEAPPEQHEEPPAVSPEAAADQSAQPEKPPEPTPAEPTPGPGEGG